MSTIPVALTEEQFTTHSKPHLSVAKRGCESEQPLFTIFNLVLYVLHTGFNGQKPQFRRMPAISR